MDDSLSFVALLFLTGMAILTWSVPRRYALIPLLITTCYMPLGQMFVFAGIHLQLFRILLLVGLCRVVTRGETAGLKMTLLDKIFLYWAAATVVIGTMSFLSFARFINCSGEAYNALISYFLFRCWIRSPEDAMGCIQFLAWMIVPLAVSMMIEKSTARNVFAVFGGVPPITEVREGTLRCQGAFRHPILAGTYGATLFPLFVGLWFQPRFNKRAAMIGFLSSIIVTAAAGSSGALLALMSALIGFVLWKFKDRMRLFRWGLIAMVAALAMVMKAPVWFVIARISEISGGTGWHRSYLIDQAINHFSEWWLVGSTYTAHWAPAGQVLAIDPNNMDITNQYVAEGLGGGVVKLGLFIAMIVRGYKTVGRLARRPDIAPSRRLFFWSVGVCLTAHCVSFISVSYFDQIVVMWYWLLAILSMLAGSSAVFGAPVRREVKKATIVSEVTPIPVG